MSMNTSSTGGSECDRQALTEDLPVGGQAVIEGVMMRVPGRIVTAVRRPNGQIAVRDKAYQPLTTRFPRLNVPVVRGAVSFVEMMVIGLGALNYSADVAMQEEADQSSEAEAAPQSSWKDQAALGLTLVVAMAFGIGLFFFTPLLAADFLGAERNALRFNIVAGVVRATLLLLYMWGISQWGEIRRVFEYHGAEHKSIFTLEAGAELTVESARPQGRLHPRCGTSFMLIVVLLAVVVFAVVDSLFVVLIGHPQNLLERFLTHLLMLPLIGGLGFELLKLSGRKRHHPLTRLLIAPGLWLQRITTQEPDDGQLEVALTALRCALAESETAASAATPS
jgi:uncharacterized protein YqhQ